MTSCAVINAVKGGLIVVACTALRARFNFFHSDGFGALPHGWEDAGLMAFAASLSVCLATEGDGSVRAVGPG